MIVKIQASQFTTEQKQQMLIYDESRDYEYEGDITPEIVELLKGRPKAYFHAKIEGTKFVIEGESETQNW